MQIQHERNTDVYTISFYRPEEVWITPPTATGEHGAGGRIVLRHSFILTPQLLQQEWPPNSMEQLEVEALKVSAALEPEVLLLGTGDTTRFPDNRQTEALVKLGIGYEVMNSAAACRTYNVLAAEQRRVIAAIILEV